MIFSLKRSALSITLLSLCAVAPSVASNFSAYTILSAKSLKDLSTKEQFDIVEKLNNEYSNTEDISEDYHKQQVALKAVDVFDGIVANNDYKADTLLTKVDNIIGNNAASKGCKANGYWLSRLYEDLHILEESFSMMTKKQKEAKREISRSPKKTVDQTRAEEYAAFKQLIQNVINKRLKTKWGKFAWATMKTKNFVCNKTTQRVAGAAALITLGYLAHRKGLDRTVVSTVSNGVTGAYETVLSETARNAIAVAAQKSAHAVVHTTVKAVEVAKKAGSKTVDVAKNVYAYVVGFLKRRAFLPVK